VPPDASKTKAKLLDSAARAFASDGVFNASLIGAGRWKPRRNRHVGEVGVERKLD